MYIEEVQRLGRLDKGLLCYSIFELKLWYYCTLVSNLRLSPSHANRLILCPTCTAKINPMQAPRPPQPQCSFELVITQRQHIYRRTWSAHVHRQPCAKSKPLPAACLAFSLPFLSISLCLTCAVFSFRQTSHYVFLFIVLWPYPASINTNNAVRLVSRRPRSSPTNHWSLLKDWWLKTDITIIQSQQRHRV